MIRSGPSVVTGGLLALWAVAGSSLTVWPGRTRQPAVSRGFVYAYPFVATNGPLSGTTANRKNALFPASHTRAMEFAYTDVYVYTNRKWGLPIPSRARGEVL